MNAQFLSISFNLSCTILCCTVVSICSWLKILTQCSQLVTTSNISLQYWAMEDILTSKRRQFLMQLCQSAHGTSICSPPKSSSKYYIILNSSKLFQTRHCSDNLSWKACAMHPALLSRIRETSKPSQPASDLSWGWWWKNWTACRRSSSQRDPWLSESVGSFTGGGCLFGFSVWIRQEKPPRSREDRRAVGLLGRCCNRFIHHFDPFCNVLSHVLCFKRRRQYRVS